LAFWLLLAFAGFCWLFWLLLAFLAYVVFDSLGYFNISKSDKELYRNARFCLALASGHFLKDTCKHQTSKGVLDV